MAAVARHHGAYLWYVAAAVILTAVALAYAWQSGYRAHTSASTSASTSINASSNAIIPGPYPQGSCPAPVYLIYGSIVGHQGFERYNVSGLADYVMPASSNGTISYTVHIGANPFGTNSSTENRFSNWAELSHLSVSNAVLNTHPGINVSINPQNETVQFNSSYRVSVYITAVPSALLGTYMVSLSPGFCNGGPVFLLTIGSNPYNGTAPGKPVP